MSQYQWRKFAKALCWVGQRCSRLDYYAWEMLVSLQRSADHGQMRVLCAAVGLVWNGHLYHVNGQPQG